MATTNKPFRDAKRTEYMTIVRDLLSSKGDEILTTGSNEFAVPCVLENGEEDWLVLTFKMPNGSRDGEAYDGYSVAEDYKMRQTAKREKAEENAKKKAEKIAKDKARREARAEARKREKGE